MKDRAFLEVLEKGFGEKLLSRSFSPGVLPRPYKPKFESRLNRYIVPYTIFSCLTLWSMMCLEASSRWTSSTVMPIWVMSTMTW